VTKEDLLAQFSKYKVKDAILPTKRYNTSQNIGYGFVEFEDEEELQKVLREVKDVTIDGRTCHINPAHE
jgi:RNA recognition motif-containing protein